LTGFVLRINNINRKKQSLTLLLVIIMNFMVVSNLVLKSNRSYFVFGILTMRGLFNEQQSK